MNMKINAELIIFDLDGTLIDSRRDIAVSVNETLEALSLPALSKDLIYSYVGNGVRPLLERAVREAGLENGLERAVEIFRQVYPKRLLETTVMFDGVEDVLTHFLSLGKKMAVASNKPYRYVEDILNGLDMTGFFLSVKGGDSQKRSKPEPDMLNSIMSETGVGSGSTVFVGDSGVDIQTGKNSAVRTIGVTYGFRSREEVVKNLPDVIAEHPVDLKEIIE
jgi:phosphoglycolate phosphatase